MDREVTAWYVKDSAINGFEFNHLEYGHNEKERPEPFSQQQSWWNSKNILWKKEFGYLDKNNKYYVA